ncbi:hypothetical protein ABZ372_14780 [Streptomyces sp. NPDC005921]
MIGLISATAAGAAARDRLAAAWPDRTRVYDGPVGDAVRSAFAECEQLVCFLATGAVVRLIAPLLREKATDPGVVCVDEGGRFAVSLVGGHGGGANELAVAVGEVLAARPVVTTATDAVGLPGLDTLDSHLGYSVQLAPCTSATGSAGRSIRYDFTLQGALVPRWDQDLALAPAATDGGGASSGSRGAASRRASSWGSPRPCRGSRPCPPGSPGRAGSG